MASDYSVAGERGDIEVLARVAFRIHCKQLFEVPGFVFGNILG
jgi:hypothetical protein